MEITCHGSFAFNNFEFYLFASNKCYHLLIIFANSLDPDQDQQNSKKIYPAILSQKLLRTCVDKIKILSKGCNSKEGHKKKDIPAIFLGLSRSGPLSLEQCPQLKPLSYTFMILAKVELQYTLIYQIVTHLHDA